VIRIERASSLAAAMRTRPSRCISLTSRLMVGFFTCSASANSASESGRREKTSTDKAESFAGPTPLAKS